LSSVCPLSPQYLFPFRLPSALLTTCALGCCRSQPFPSSVQYHYHHPIYVHRTSVTVPGDYLCRRFDSIEAATKWIDKFDRNELSTALAGEIFVPSTAAPSSAPSSASSAVKQHPAQPGSTDDPDITTVTTALQQLRVQKHALPAPSRARARRASDPGSTVAPQRRSASGVFNVAKVSKSQSSTRVWKDKKRFAPVGRKYGVGHLDVKRRELLRSIAASDDEGTGKGLGMGARLARLEDLASLGGPTRRCMDVASSSGAVSCGVGRGETPMEIDEEL